jgi:lysophospholipase L1-like esterase
MTQTDHSMMQKTPTIVFLGDSVTEGVIGASFVDRVRTALDGEARVINSGINGDTVVNMRWRVGRDVAAHRPDLVVVMSGLNDIATAYARPLQRIYYRLLKGNMVNLTPRRFAAHYRALLGAIRSQTQAQIVLATPTILTEDPDAPVQALVETYANVVRGLAHQQQLPLIDMRAAFLHAVRADPRPGPTYELMVAVRDMWAIRRGQVTYPELTARRGFRLLCDGAHLAEAGADLAAATAIPRIREIVGDGLRPAATRPTPTSRYQVGRSETGRY